MQIFLSIKPNDSQRVRLESIAGADNLCLRANYADNAGIERGFRKCALVFGNVPAAWISASTELRWMQLDSDGTSDDELDRKIDVFANNLARFRASEPLEGVVNSDRGY